MQRSQVGASSCARKIGEKFVCILFCCRCPNFFFTSYFVSTAFCCVPWLLVLCVIFAFYRVICKRLLVDDNVPGVTPDEK